MTREEKVERALLDILSQATRKDRATIDKPYLLNDLEIIARKAHQALNAKDDREYPTKGQIMKFRAEIDVEIDAPSEKVAERELEQVVYELNSHLSVSADIATFVQKRERAGRES